MRIITRRTTLILLAALALPTTALAAEKDCDPTTQSLKCCNERGGTWREETRDGKTIGFCFEVRFCFDLLESEPNTLDTIPAVDVRLPASCLESAVDPELKELIVRNHLPFPVDTLVLDLPQGAAKQAAAVELPAGWKVEREKSRRLVIAGEPTAGPFRVKLALGDAKLPRKIDTTVLAAGRVLLRGEGIPVPPLPPVRTVNRVSGVVVLPPVVSPGETIQARVLDPPRTPPGGEWRIGGVVVEPESESERDETLLVTLPGGLAIGGGLAVHYTDPFGRVVVDVPAAEGVEVLPPSGEPVAGPAITGGSEHVFAGETACVCGRFPGPDAWGALALDGEALGAPLAASGRVVSVALPANLEPGGHVFQGSPAAGFSDRDIWEFRVVTVRGEIDQAQLMAGGSTTLRLAILGTEEPLSLRLSNRNPQAISLQGGDEQVATSSGGEDNRIERRVQAISRGTFDIDWELEGDPCPCAREMVESR